MKTIFADTFYFLAQFNPRDKAHEKAANFTNSFQGRMVTTDWVIVEVAVCEQCRLTNIGRRSPIFYPGWQAVPSC